MIKEIFENKGIINEEVTLALIAGGVAISSIVNYMIGYSFGKLFLYKTKDKYLNEILKRLERDGLISNLRIVSSYSEFKCNGHRIKVAYMDKNSYKIIDLTSKRTVSRDVTYDTYEETKIKFANDIRKVYTGKG